jgi:hypothetical protein
MYILGLSCDLGMRSALEWWGVDHVFSVIQGRIAIFKG